MAAQLYVVWPRFPELLRSRIIGYVWDATTPVATVAKSHKTGTVTFVVMRSGSEDLGKWLTERRNVAEDYAKIFGESPDDPRAITISIDSMTPARWLNPSWGRSSSVHGEGRLPAGLRVKIDYLAFRLINDCAGQ